MKKGLHHATLTDTLCAIERDIIVMLNDSKITLIFDTELTIDNDAQRRYNRRINPATIEIGKALSQECLDTLLPF